MHFSSLVSNVRSPSYAACTWAIASLDRSTPYCCLAWFKLPVPNMLVRSKLGSGTSHTAVLLCYPVVFGVFVVGTMNASKLKRNLSKHWGSDTSSQDETERKNNAFFPPHCDWATFRCEAHMPSIATDGTKMMVQAYKLQTGSSLKDQLNLFSLIYSFSYLTCIMTNERAQTS